MNAAQHTKGPWFFDAITGRIVGADGKTLAFASAAHETSLQNGPVLAAAPELLAQLQRLLSAYRALAKLGHSEDDAYTVGPHNAIAAATGGAQP